jgi:nucleoid-associated protein YgaU
MQRDLKIGLSLGVLLIGVIGAFFFRREPQSDRSTPRLQTAEHLDAQIAEKSSPGPYMLPPEADDDDPFAPPEKNRPPLTQSPPQFQLPDFLQQNPAESQETQVARNPAAPDPIRMPGSEKRTANGGPAHNRSWDTVPAAPASHDTARGNEQRDGRTHVIQPGDTLTSLASRYLGSQTRFQEIYRANRELLPDPDRLPLGATIQIPADKPAAAEPKPAVADSSPKRESKTHTVSQTETAMSTNSSTPPAVITDIVPRKEKPADETPPADSSDKKPSRSFTRVSRTPFSAGRTPRTGASQPESKDPVPRSPGDAGAKRYQIRKGDTLARIAQKVYGQSGKAQEIFEANRDRLSSPDSVREGLEIVLP